MWDLPLMGFVPLLVFKTDKTVKCKSRLGTKNEALWSSSLGLALKRITEGVGWVWGMYLDCKGQVI